MRTKRKSFVTAQGDLLSNVNYSCAIKVNNSNRELHEMLKGILIFNYVGKC